MFFRFSVAFSYYGIVLLTTELFQAGESCGGKLTLRPVHQSKTLFILHQTFLLPHSDTNRRDQRGL